MPTCCPTSSAWSGASASGDATYRGRDGALTVTDIDWHDPLCEAFIAGAVSLGIPRNPDYNGATQEGVSYAQRTIHKGRRVSAATAFLRPAMQRPNVQVRTHAHATSIVLDGKRAVGVRYAEGRARRRADRGPRTRGSDPGGRHLQFAAVAAAIGHRPGAAAVLARHRGAPRAGRRRRRPAGPLRARARSPACSNIKTINERARGLNLAAEVLKWGATRRGILSLSPTLVYCFWHSGETAESSDLQLTFTPASYKEGEQGQLEDEPGMTVAAWQQRPESRGYVRCRSADPFEAPIIQTNYLAEELDRRVVVAGMRLARRLLASAPLAPYYEREDFPGPGVQTDAEFLAAATQRAQTTFHPGCTCRMGPATHPLSVVDDQLRVHGLQGLRVIDASIMPRMISANLNASTLMIADKASDLIRGRTAPEAVAIPA